MEGYREIILEAVFPTHCVSCGRDGVWCCADCLQAIELVAGRPCADCGSLKEGHACEARGYLQGLAVAGFYHDPRLRSLIHGLKYRYATCLETAVLDLLRRYAAERIDPWPWAGERALAIQAVVGAPERVRARGFDQAELLRETVRSNLVPWAEPVSLLERRDTSGPQVEIDPGPLRQANVHGAFRLSSRPSDLSQLPSSVLLVDDVMTTGSTLHEAARVLREGGVSRIYGFALALGT